MTAPIHIQLSRAKGWRLPANTVVVARPTRWGNPFKIGGYRCEYDDQGQLQQEPTPDAETAVRFFAEMLASPKRNYAPATAIDIQLRGRNLACWCQLDRPCHADVLLEFANAEAKS